MIEKYVKLWIGSPQGAPPVVRLSQYDTEWKLICTLYDGDAVHTVADGDVVLIARRAGGTVVTAAGEVEEPNVCVTLPSSVTAVPGKMDCEIRVAQEGIVSSANFTVSVEESPINEHGIREDEFDGLNQLINRAITASAGAQEAAARAAVIPSNPFVIITSTDDIPVDHTKGFVWAADTTASYEKGAWYYYNGSGWVKGGTATDATLTVSGAAADSKSVGKAVALVGSQMAEVAKGFNLVDTDRLAEVPNWSYSAEQEAYYGTATKLSNAAGTTIFRDVNNNFKADTRYKVTFKAKTAAAPSTGNGLRLYFKYTDDSTGEAVTIKRNATTWATYTTTSAAGKSLASIIITYSGGGTDVYYIKDFEVRESVPGGAATAIDQVARGQIADSMPLQPTGDTTDRAAEILGRLSDYGHCELGAGDYYLSSIDMPPDSQLSGVGNATRLIMLGADIDAHANYLTVDLLAKTGVVRTALGYVGTAAQFAGALTPRNAYATEAGTAYKICARAQRVGGTPSDNAGLSIIVTHHSGDEEPTTSYISPSTFIRDGRVIDFSYTTDPNWIVDSVGLTYYNGGADTWRISNFTIAPETYSDGSGTAGYAIRMTKKCVLSDFMLLGAEADITPVATTPAAPPANEGRDGIRLVGTGSDDAGAWFGLIKNLFIRNFSDSGIKAYDTGYATSSGSWINDVRIVKCGTGLQLNRFAEFFRCSGVKTHLCSVGTLCTGGNNYFVNCDFSSCQVGILMDNSSGNMTNNSHGAFIACSVIHSRGEEDWTNNMGTALRMIGMTVGELFVGCSLLRGAIEIQSSKGVIFTGCHLPPSGGSGYDQSGNPWSHPLSFKYNSTVIFDGCIIHKTTESSVNVEIDATSKVIWDNCYNHVDAMPFYPDLITKDVTGIVSSSAKKAVNGDQHKSVQAVNAGWGAVTITARNDKSAYVTFTTADLDEVETGADVPLASGEGGRRAIPAGETETLRVPDDCDFIVIHDLQSDAHYYPRDIKFYKVGTPEALIAQVASV